MDPDPEGPWLTGTLTASEDAREEGELGGGRRSWNPYKTPPIDCPLELISKLVGKAYQSLKQRGNLFHPGTDPSRI